MLFCEREFTDHVQAKQTQDLHTRCWLLVILQAHSVRALSLEFIPRMHLYTGFSFILAYLPIR